MLLPADPGSQRHRPPPTPQDGRHIPAARREFISSLDDLPLSPGSVDQVGPPALTEGALLRLPCSVDVADRNPCFQSLAFTIAAEQKVDGRAIGDELVRLSPPSECLP